MAKTDYQQFLNYPALNRVMDGLTKLFLKLMTPVDALCGVSRALAGRIVTRLPQDVHAVVVFGCGYVHVNTQIEKRLNAAYSLYLQDPSLTFYLSGTEDGKGYSEPDYMRASLHARGVPEEQMVLDGKGYTTEQTVENCLGPFGLRRLIVATSDYHLRRCVYLFRQRGADAYGLAVERDPDPYRYRYWLRDVAALYRSVFRGH